MASRGGTTEQAENKVEALPTDRVCQPGQSKPSRNNLRLRAERWPLESAVVKFRRLMWFKRACDDG